MSYTCVVNEECDFMYYCASGTCQHYEVFPLQVYPSLIYLLIPVAAGLCNLSGNSMGMFKIIILMNLLRYTINDATAIIQAAVVGAALPNFVEIIKQKHPNGKTSLVNYNIILILIPCCLYGSTIGSLVQSILPEFVQDVLIFAMFSFFSFKFIKKARKQFSLLKSEQRDSLITTEETRQSFGQRGLLEESKEYKKEGPQKISLSDNIESSEQKLGNLKKVKKGNRKGKKSKKLGVKKMRKEIRTYEKSIHLRDIIESVIVFIGFELLVFFVQGKIPYLEFNKCSLFYLFGLLLLTFMTGTYLFLVKRQMIRKFSHYQLVKFPTDLDIPNQTVFLKIILGGFGAGLVQGTLGVGAGTFEMAVLLALNVDSRVAAATSGYQILFTGSAALIQQFINKQITLEQGLFFFAWTAVSGGIVTVILYKVIKKVDANKMKRILLLIISALCFISLVLVIPVTIQRIQKIGWSEMNKSHFQC